MEQTPTFQVQEFGNYYLLDRIAIGGMAEIFKAKQSGVRGFEKIVVIKKILQHLSEDPEFVEMFEDEAKIAAQLNHANIVQIYELGEVAETLYITMEFVEGRNLRDVTRAIASKGLHLSVAQCIHIIIEVLKGLDYAHRKKNAAGKNLEIVHRDMSPQNITVSYEGEVKILDFGIAKATSKISRTEAGVLKGKFSYMSPEQASGQEIDQRTDIFAVGVIFHELLTSKRLFKADSDLQTLERVKIANVAKPSETNSQIDSDLDAIVLKALKQNSDDRYQTSAEFLRELTQYALQKQILIGGQELAGFMHSLFDERIAQEREDLQRALAEIPMSPIQKIQAAKTHIAFKADYFPGEVAEAKRLADLKKNKKSPQEVAPSKPLPKENEEVTQTKNIKTPSKRSTAFAILFIAAIVVYLIAGNVDIQTLLKNNNEPPMPPTAPMEPQPTPEESDQPLDAPAAPLPSTQKPSTPEETPVQPPVRTPLEDVFDLPEDQQTEDPPPEPKPQPRPGLEINFGTIDMVGVENDFAEVFINGKEVGPVPGANARGIKLREGRHLIECRTQFKTYSGYVWVEAGNEAQIIRCDSLGQN